jgi:hypothetical protein
MNAMLVTKIRDKKYGFMVSANSTILLLCFANTNQVAETVNQLTVSNSIYILTWFFFFKKQSTNTECVTWFIMRWYQSSNPSQQTFYIG